jgi:hypothetical protein
MFIGPGHLRFNRRTPPGRFAGPLVARRDIFPTPLQPGFRDA